MSLKPGSPVFLIQSPYCQKLLANFRKHRVPVPDTICSISSAATEALQFAMFRHSFNGILAGCLWKDHNRWESHHVGWRPWE